MKRKNKKIPPYMKDELYSGVASANEFTGFTATVPLDGDEAASYREMGAKNVTSEKTAKKNDRGKRS